ncbi:hypothetical protein L1987_24647 [Smallanthus sonchifolius]|uniref:Uncharacterized protein n=1 Tax=Smallanthus sonchifolius TaxID=185202 RepID=A0ACB9IKB1_9ASTR|nr:hypothetical protein L1987_24647 [Smallanthus sonchifolius]
MEAASLACFCPGVGVDTLLALSALGGLVRAVDYLKVYFILDCFPAWKPLKCFNCKELGHSTVNPQAQILGAEYNPKVLQSNSHIQFHIAGVSIHHHFRLRDSNMFLRQLHHFKILIHGLLDHNHHQFHITTQHHFQDRRLKVKNEGLTTPEVERRLKVNMKFDLFNFGLAKMEMKNWDCEI